MRLLLLVCVSVVMLYSAQSTSVFNRNDGLLRAFTGALPENTDRDTDVLSIASATPAVAAGTDIGIPTGFFKAFGENIDVMVCFQTGFCEASTAAAAGWAITAPPMESPAGTGMAVTHANVLFAPYVIPLDDAANSYGMAYRLLDYANTYDQADIEDMLGRKYDSVLENKNLITNSELSAYKGIVVTWSITGAGTSKFQFVLLSDGTNDYVFYLYDTMGLAGGVVRGFATGGATAGNTARICSKFATAATDTDAALIDADLPLNSNYKCGKPGNYLFDVSSASSADFCGVTATECSVSYTTPKKSCNATSAPMDSCLVSSFCRREDAANPTRVTLTVHVNWYELTAGVDTYMQALMYSSWQSDVTAVAEEQQVFVEKDAAPSTGTCGKTLTLDEETITITFDTAAAEKDRCGITVDAGPPEVIYFAFKIFEYTYDAMTAVTDFGPNAMIDKWGDWIITGKCAPDDLPISVSVAVEFNGPSTPTSLPMRPREVKMEVVDDIDDAGAVVLSNVQLGQYYYIRICFDRGTPFNKQADPFGVHTVSCSVSNKADFTVANAAEDAVVEFIADSSGESCPIAAGTTTGPMYMDSDFKVRSTAAEYDETDATGVFPASPWCIYTDKIRAARWNKFQTMVGLQQKIWLKCTIGFCTKFDFTTATSEGSKCKDNCSTAKRRKREVSNDTSSYPREVLYTSVIYEEPEEAREEFCAADSSDFTIAMATVITLIALLCVAVVAAILVFVKLLGASKRSEKENRFK